MSWKIEVGGDGFLSRTQGQAGSRQDMGVGIGRTRIFG